MYEFIQGKIIELTPTYIVLQTGGIGYFIHISLHTYSQMQNHDNNDCKLYIHQAIREDAHLLYGFQTRSERSLFRLLITVSGVGTNTALMVLSSLPPTDLQTAILSNNIAAIKAVKGIGIKTAQRIILDLKDKVEKGDGSSELLIHSGNDRKEEALSALIALGFTKKEVEKTVEKILVQSPNSSLEDLVKSVLKGGN